MIKKNQQNPSELPRVYKDEEYGLMCRFIKLGLWRDSNLSRVVGVDRQTIGIWKLRPEAIEAYQQACDVVLKKRRNRGDVEKELKELNIEVDEDKLEVNVATSQWSDEQLKQFIDTETARRNAG